MGEEIAVGRLIDCDIRFDVRRDSTLSIKDEGRKLGILINIKGVQPVISGQYDDVYAEMPARRVLVVAMKDDMKLDFMVEGRLNEQDSSIDADGMAVVFDGEDGKTYTMSYGALSETAVFKRD